MELARTAEELLLAMERRLAESPAQQAALASIGGGCLELRLSGGQRWHLLLRPGSTQLLRGPAVKADGVVTMDLEDFIALVRGELRAGPAWVDGRLKLAGDLGFMLRVGDVLGSLLF